MKFDAIVLAGGGARRLDGADKALVPVDGRTLLERALDAVADAQKVVVVGPERNLDQKVIWTSEQPPGGGPVAALDHGLRHVSNDLVALLGVDMPFVTRALVHKLAASVGSSDGAMLVDAAGMPQPLAAVYRRAHLVEAIETLPVPAGAPLTAVTKQLELEELPDEGTSFDCNTWDDVKRAEELMRARVREEGGTC